MAKLAAGPSTVSRRAVAVLGAFALALAWVVGIPAPASADGPTTFSNTAAIAIPATGSANQTGPASPYPSNISVAGMTGAVITVTVTFASLTHAILGDVDALVVAPSGQNLMVLSDAGAVNSFVTATNATLTFSDAAAAGIPTTPGASIPTGTYKPTNGGVGADTMPAPSPTPSTNTTLAEAFTGINPNGTWQLFVVDDTSGDLGQMAGGWSLTITTEAAANPTTTTVTTSGSPSTTGASVQFTATVTAGGVPVNAGTVQFSADGTNLGTPVPVNGAGAASLSTAVLAEGTHLIRATYNGATGYLTSNGTVTQRVDNATVVTGNTFCNTGALTVPQQGRATPYPSNITVSGLTGQVTKVVATLKGVSQTHPPDFDILLSGPTPTTNLYLLSDAGGQTAASNVNLNFDDAAATTVPAPLVSGTYKPTNLTSDAADVMPAPAPTPSSATTLATFNGASGNGVWSLWVVDDASGDSGSISGGWCLTVTSQSPTVTTLVAAPNPSNAGDDVTFTATVTSGGAPVTSGSVQFLDGATALGAPVGLGAGGTATLTTSALAAGTHTIHATFGATATLGESTDDVDQVVALRATVTALTSSVNPSSVGDPVTFTATVTSGGAPVTAGSVQFLDGATALGVPVGLGAGGTATLTTSALAAGTHTIHATFGATATLGESTDDVDQVVALRATVTALTSSVNPSSVGDPVTFTATVTSGGAPVTAGSVQFLDGATALGVPVGLGAGGTATLTTSALAAGTHTIHATFGATATLAESTDDLDQAVDLRATATALTSSVNPSSVGDPVTFTATVTSGGAPVTAGSVQFLDGATALGAQVGVAADGTATLTTSALAAGTHTIHATFAATATLAGSTQDLEQVVEKLATATAVTSVPNPSTFGQSVTITATVTSGGAPAGAGTVQFRDGSTAIGAAVAVAADGTALVTVTDLTAGTHSIVAEFSGTDTYATSSGTLDQSVGQATSSTTVTSSANPSTFGQTVTFRATVTSAGAPYGDGTVRFTSGATVLCGAVALAADGSATCATDALGGGSHTVTATFSGTDDVTGSSATVDQVVTPAASTTTVATSGSPSSLGDDVTFTATVTAGADPVGAGAVEFSVDGGTPGTPVDLAADGTAAWTTGDLAGGSHTITAHFTGTADHAQSSGTVTQAVTVDADAGGPYTVAEGGSITLNGSGSSQGATYAWDLNGDTGFTDATGESPTLTWTQLQALGINDGPGQRQIALQVRSGTVTEFATATLSVTNTAPTVVLTGGMTATSGVPFTVKVGADDPSSADMAAQFTYTVDWGDGSAVQTVTGPADPPVTHTYTTPGNYAATFSATDKDGGQSGPPPGGTPVTVQAAPAAVTPTPTPTPTPTSTSTPAPTATGTATAAPSGSGTSTATDEASQSETSTHEPTATGTSTGGPLAGTGAGPGFGIAGFGALLALLGAGIMIANRPRGRHE